MVRCVGVGGLGTQRTDGQGSVGNNHRSNEPPQKLRRRRTGQTLDRGCRRRPRTASTRMLPPFTLRALGTAADSLAGCVVLGCVSRVCFPRSCLLSSHIIEFALGSFSFTGSVAGTPGRTLRESGKERWKVGKRVVISDTRLPFRFFPFGRHFHARPRDRQKRLASSHCVCPGMGAIFKPGEGGGFVCRVSFSFSCSQIRATTLVGLKTPPHSLPSLLFLF